MAANTEKDFEELRKEFSELRSDVAKLTDTLKKLYGDTTAEGSERARQAAGYARDRARDSVDAVEQEISSRPLTSIAAAFGIGFIIGKLLDR